MDDFSDYDGGLTSEDVEEILIRYGLVSEGTQTTLELFGGCEEE